MLQGPTPCTMQISESYQSVSNGWFGEGHLKRCARPETIVEVAGEYWPCAAMVKFQVAHAIIQPGKQGYGLLESRTLTRAPDLDFEALVRTGVAIASTACASASDRTCQTRSCAWGLGGAYFRQLGLCLSHLIRRTLRSVSDVQYVFRKN